jgi:hypothetical protein
VYVFFSFPLSLTSNHGSAVHCPINLITVSIIEVCKKTIVMFHPLSSYQSCTHILSWEIFPEWITFFLERRVDYLINLISWHGLVNFLANEP